LIVIDGDLNLRPRESGAHEEQAQPGLHRGLGLGLGQVNDTPKPGDALGSRMLLDVAEQLGDGDHAGMKEQVRGHDAFCQRIPATEVDHRAER
jgi:hypothetical protein